MTGPPPNDYGFASEEDDAGLRALLHETPMDGKVRVSLEREPSFFGAARREAPLVHTVRARELGSGRVFAMASRSVREVHVDGRPARAGYLGQLRIAPSHRHLAPRILRTGFELLRTTMRDDELPFDFTSIAEDNFAARRLLEAGLRTLPLYQFVGRMNTVLLPVRGGRGRPSTAAGGETATVEETPGLREFWQRQAAAWQLSPRELPGGLPCHLSRDSAGKITGCVARWDQRDHKQVVVRGYRGWLSVGHRWCGLPPPGGTLPLGFLCHLAVADDQPASWLDLLDRALAAANPTGLKWLALGMAESHPLFEAVLRRWRPRCWTTRIHIVRHRPTAGGKWAELPPGIEATLAAGSPPAGGLRGIQPEIAGL